MALTKFEVPKYSIGWLIARLHVGTSDADIEADLRKRLSKSLLTPAQFKKCLVYALKCHKENQNLYNRVMS